MFFYLFLLSYSFTPVDDDLLTVYTKWGENFDKNNVLPEYPRPQFERTSYKNLNGVWEYSIRDTSEEPAQYDGEIVVPFSPEAPLSGVGKQLLPKQTMWYKRTFDFSNFVNDGRIILQFGAVDQTCEVYVNDQKVGEHDGGYTAFSIDITDVYAKITDKSKVTIKVKVIDNLTEEGAAYGKQSAKRGGIWYTATSGIWQTVWVESVPETYLQNVKILPNYDAQSVQFTAEVIGSNSNKVGKVYVYDGEQKIGECELKNGQATEVKIQNMKSWSPESPFLYSVEFMFENDFVKSYFGMRKFSIGEDDKGIKRLFLNNKPYFHNGLLDQGYWSDGYYTAPTDEANIYDIQTMKDLGFNMLRKHIKIEPMRWYYHCDRLGMLVWQDAVSGGYPYHSTVIQILPFIGIKINDKHYSIFGRSSELGRNNFHRDLKLMINQLYNVPSISTWVPFNEGWGQFDALKAVEIIKSLDTSRHIDHASGWHDQGGDDFSSFHVYFVKYKLKKDKLNRPIVLSEFGGYSHTIEGHIGSKSQFGYKKYKTIEKLNEAIKKLYNDQIIPAIEQGLSATVYTQVSDVEDEVNGLFTYDRKILKADQNMFKEINQKMHL
ncbi:glycoside hydrolase family 2 [Histomonas meleagridis]|uniref:glycoside hydrolase family 2 n=1 Tax=Histomonas meleagridis TaxID=135588 RepID=UPI003559735C|nr:glycoside hydrolase family 2 [Histomonas meleagridis]KAH0802687.1 glycoside hydrolase family 2 [Histomonas meleagridis]